LELPAPKSASTVCALSSRTHPDKLIQAVVYTDSTEVLKEVAIRPGQGRSAVELIDGVATPRNGSSTGHDDKELAQELAQKDPSFSSAQVAPTEKEIQEAVRQCQKPYSSTSSASHIIPLPVRSQTTIGHKNQGSAGVSDQKQKCSIRLIRASIAGRSALRK
jgi:hypothetical protein